MDGLLKEALKSLCDGSQWCYAVFWKIGCQNAKLLIWEECYYEHALSTSPQNPELPFGEWEECWGSKTSSQIGSQLSDKVHLLINKMMVDNHINIIGQGLVGRAAFTGNHQWILANNYISDVHPPEVLNEAHLQFSAGIQTVAVIPILPHGVIQLGSATTVMENIGFVNDVKSLILRLGCIPAALLSNSYGTNEYVEKIGTPISMDCGLVGAEIIPSNSSLWLNPQVLSRNSQSRSDSQPIIGQSIASHSSIISIKRQVLPDAGLQNHGINSASASNSQVKPKPVPSIVPYFNKLEGTSCTLREVGSSRVEVLLPMVANQLNNTRMLSGIRNQGHEYDDHKGTRADVVPKTESTVTDLFQALDNSFRHAEDGIPFIEQLPSASLNVKYEDSCIRPSSGDDLFDLLGADLKSRLLNAEWNDLLAEEPDSKMQNMGKGTSMFRDTHNVFSDNFPSNAGISDNVMYSDIGMDHLLDAVVSSAQCATKQISDDSVSCRTTLTKFPNSSVPSSSPTFGQVNISNHVQGELHDGLPKSLSRGFLPSSSYRSGCSKDDTMTCSQTTSMYGSQVTSWVEQGHNTRHDSSVSTAYSKRNDEMTKPNRKKVKSGENPRPRPKDRQMIQDRLKELREIVPNGAKCSIDTLLEKTIKHMLFLQSVTKHADKLKQTGESKIKENFEGGATWAFEVGSQSMICPIVVEDLGPPRQMLVKMLCEEQGFFLEIADLIRGLGLTILKGVMETRNGKIWARFAVEANRDVTRVEIFMSLVRLLDQTMKVSTSSANVFDSNNMMVHHPFHEAASLPATGHANGLQ